MRKQHEHGNFYRRPIPETMTATEFVEGLRALCEAARLLSDVEFVRRGYFVQDVGAVTAAEWKLNVNRSSY